MGATRLLVVDVAVHACAAQIGTHLPPLSRGAGGAALPHSQHRTHPPPLHPPPDWAAGVCSLGGQCNPAPPPPRAHHQPPPSPASLVTTGIYVSYLAYGIFQESLFKKQAVRAGAPWGGCVRA